MKKICLIAILIIAGLLVCNKQEIPDTNKESLESYIKVAGEEHNKGLDYVFEQLKYAKENKQLNIQSSKNVLSVVESSLKEFLVNHNNQIISKNAYQPVEYANISIKAVGFSLRKSKSGDVNNTLWNSEIEDSLTVLQKELLTILGNAIDDDNLDYNSTIEIFENVRKRVLSEFSENEQFYLISAIEIGVHSLTYWHDNISKWVELLGDGSNSKSWFSWKTVGKEDVKGVVAGATGVGVAALITGTPGWAVGSAVVAGATVGGSAASAIGQVLDYYW